MVSYFEEKKLCELTDNNLGTCVLEDKEIVFANGVLAERLGYSVSELIHKEIGIFVHPQDRERLYEALQVVSSSAESMFIPLRILSKNSGIFCMALTLNNLMFRGKPATLVNFLDIETLKEIQKEAENELFKLQKAIFEAIPHAIMGLENRKVIFANNAVYDIFGWHPEELIGKSMRLLFHSDREYEEEGKKFYSVLKKLKTHRIEFTYRRKDGTDVTCLTSVSRIGDDPDNMRIVATHTDITRMKKIQHECDVLHDQLCMYTDHLHDMVERERSMIAQEMHDKIGQTLTILKMNLFKLKKDIAPQEEDIRKRFELTLSLVDSTIRSMRNLAAYLRPILLDDLGLIAAVEWLLEEFQYATGLDVELNYHPIFKHVEFSKKFSTNLYRILQESLTNIVRHANATKVWVKMHYKRGTVMLTVRDNGCGINTKKIDKSRTFGIIGMKERANLLGGKLWVRNWHASAPGIGGAIVVAHIPISKEKERQ